MTGRMSQMKVLTGLTVGLVIALITSAGALGATLHPALIVPKTSPATFPDGFVRTPDGTLHVAYETNLNWGMSANGIGTVTISPSGHPGPQLQALAWAGSTGGSPSGIPGLALLPGGTLAAVVGGSPSGDDGPWGIGSTNGGSVWTAPADVGSGTMEFGDGNVALANSNGTPVLAAGCCGGIVIQQGFGTGAPTYQLTNSADNAAGNANLAVDAATGAVIAGWDSNAGSGGLWLQQAAPTAGTAQKASVPSQYGTGTPFIVAGRDSGPGVFAAEPTNYGNTTHISLLRYGGGAVSVGAVKNLHANNWGVATGSNGRMWVFWYGQINGKGIIAVTRSNNAVTRFEPIQQYDFNWSSVFTMQGDGRLGPLDMLLNGSAVPPPGQPTVGGIYWARIMPALSGQVSVKKLAHGKFKLTVDVTDAGDPVKGATVSAKGKHQHPGASGVAKLTVKGSPGSSTTLTVTAPGYVPFKAKVAL